MSERTLFSSVLCVELVQGCYSVEDTRTCSFWCNEKKEKKRKLNEIFEELFQHQAFVNSNKIMIIIVFESIKLKCFNRTVFVDGEFE